MRLRSRKLLFLVLPLGVGLWTLAGRAQIKPTTGFTFVSWGDSRGDTTGATNVTDLTALSTQAAALSPAFTLFAGDLCDGFDTTCTSTSSGWTYAVNGGSLTSGNGLFAVTFPFRGNHDNDATLWDTYFGGSSTDTVDGQPVVSREAVVANIGGSNFSCYTADGTACARTYSFDYQNAHFVGIDMPRGGISSMTRGQIMWLDSDLTAAEARGVTHTFIMDHGPIYYVDGHRSKPSMALINVLNKHTSISATFHGHEHVMAHIHVDSAHIKGITHPFEEFVTGAAGAPLYTCDTSRLIGPTDYCEGTNNGLMSVNVNGSTVTVNLYFENQSPYVQQWVFSNPPTP